MKNLPAAEAETTSSRATYQDVLDAPPHKVAEVVDGTLYTHPRPAPPHAVARSELGGFLNQTFQYGRGGPGGWWIVDEPELHLDEDIVVPDIAGWRRERMPQLPNSAYFTLAQTGSVKCFLHPHESLVWVASGRSMPGRVSAMFGF